MKKLPTIALDMDGTIADLYGVRDWLEMLESENASPYLDAAPMCDTKRLDSLIRAYKDAGGHVCVVSWCAKGRYLARLLHSDAGR